MDRELLDISRYSDEEIINDLLGMSYPTDRELEIKLVQLIAQYPPGDPWRHYYEDIFNRLFSDSSDDDDDNIEEGSDDGSVPAEEPYVNMTAPNPQQKADDQHMKELEMVPAVNNPAQTAIVETKAVEYAKGHLNPLLKEIVTRTLVIDSKYRDNKNEPSTHFILNLTETLNDVVQIKMYSAQIPYSWYTISSNFGSNYFFVMGNKPGMNDAAHEFQFTIDPGNYTQATLASAVNASISQTKLQHPEINFGNTRLDYNANNSLMTFTLDIQNNFSEQNYTMYFPSPYLSTDASSTQISNRNLTIPTFLGFEGYYRDTPGATQYNLNTITSSKNVPSTSNTAANYVIDTSNNVCWFIQYTSANIGDVLFNPATATVHSANSLTIPTGTYSRSSLEYAINHAIKSLPFLNTNKSEFVHVATSSTTMYFKLTVALDRTKTANIQYSKLVILLPDDTATTKVWTGTCLQFNPQNGPSVLAPHFPSNVQLSPDIYFFPFYPSILVSDLPPLQTNYKIGSDVSIIFSCITPNYNNPANNYKVTLAPTGNGYPGYILSEYVAAINAAFANPINMETNASEPTIFNTSNVPTPFFIDAKSQGTFHIDINKVFDQSMYTVDITSTKLQDILGNSFGHFIDLSANLRTNNYTLDFSFNQLSQYDLPDDIWWHIAPSDGLDVPSYDIPHSHYYNERNGVQPAYIYTNVTLMAQDIQYSLTSFVEPNTGTNPFENVTVTIDPTLKIQDTTTYYTGQINFKFANTLTETNYTMSFWDPSGTWSTNFSFEDNSGVVFSVDNSYNLAENHVDNTTYSQVPNLGDITEAVNNESIHIDASNCQFVLAPIIDDLQGTQNTYTFNIPHPANSYRTYTRDQLIQEMNTQLQAQSDTAYSSVSLQTIGGQEYCRIVVNINNVYTSSDYNVVFYDKTQFQTCSQQLGASVGLTTWDNTLGWILGFRAFTTYNMSNFIVDTAPLTTPTMFNNTAQIVGDTTCTTALFSYFALSLDDFNQNHTNDGMVTIARPDQSIPLPSYTSKSQFICDPLTGLYVFNGIGESGTNHLTQNQIYAATQIMNNKANTGVTKDGNVPTSQYSRGPFIRDVIATFPVKTAGVQNGTMMIFDGGPLQTQTRIYFGPINLNRIEVTLLDDQGHIVNLNNSDWSFIMLVDQLYKKPE